MSKEEEAPVREVMTDEEMNNLAKELVSLLEELPENISDFLKEHCSLGGGQTDGEPIDIDVDAQSNETLYKLRKLLDDYMLEKQARQTKAESRENEVFFLFMASMSSFWRFSFFFYPKYKIGIYDILLLCLFPLL